MERLKENAGAANILLNTAEVQAIDDVLDSMEQSEVQVAIQSRDIPQELENISQEYKSTAEHQGTLKRLEYTTWESMTYAEQSKQLTKTAYVYLPYAYSVDTKYNVFYLMHGGWSNEETWFGTPEQPSEFKNVIDHAIEDGNLAFRIQEGGVHSGEYASEYAFNGLLWFWNQSGNQKDTEHSGDSLTAGSTEYRGFSVDNVLHSKEQGDIHFHLYLPDDYDGSEPYALYVTLPGYQGLYFQGGAENLKTESFGFAAQKYNDKMIIAAPQRSDWGEISANQTIELVEYLLRNDNIDVDKVYISGYSGGGETLLLVLGKTCTPLFFIELFYFSSRGIQIFS
ncbi:MAG: hypothetical protein VB070_12120 [Clostridiaceae bacterium]|nr:hypothetical protein [Clostridiaceae bacterium]